MQTSGVLGPEEPVFSDDAFAISLGPEDTGCGC